MADVNANIDINIDSSNALAQLKSLQRQISQFHTSIARSSEAAALAQKGLQKNLLNSINAIGAFTAEMRTVKTSAESFTDSLEKNKFSMREYFRYAGASTKTFGKLFKSEYDTIGKVAEERVKRLQTQFIKMGRDTNGAMRAIAVMPTELNLKDYQTSLQLAAQKQALFNQLMRQGSTNLLNFGKNTQWAGRQLMVGFTLPLMAVGTAATRTFMEMEAQAIRFKKVYGDLFTPQEETQQALDNITELGKQFTKYGVAVSTTVGLAADAAAAGFQGLDLQRQTTEATRLSILGQVDSQKALETTISLQNAFGMSSESLADSINFLNAVENQTVVSLDDITTAIPKVAPVIQQLGGDVKDLAFFLAAMKEGGINASEGANALKSGLAALINPTKKASDMLASYGINATAIVEKNKGDLKATVLGFAQALNQLDPLARARAIEQMFGKFQFARLSTLFANVAKDGNQAARVLDLANSSVEELSALSEKELGMTAESSMNKFKKSVEDLKVALIPVGEAFLQAVTPIIDFVGGILEKFSNLSDGTKKLITLLTVGIGAVGPVLLMTFGLLANGIANIIKLFLTLRGGYQRLTGQSQILGEQTQYMTMEQVDAAAAAHSLNQTHANLTQTFTAEATAINKLIAAYNSAAGASRNFAMNNPGMMLPGRGARRLASGIVSVPGPKGAGDVVPAMLSPGEAVIPTAMAKKYAPLIQGMIADNIPGYQMGKGFRNATMFLPESINTLMGQLGGKGVATSSVTQYMGGAGGGIMAPLLAVIARDIKIGINNPKFRTEFATVADLFAKTATDALNQSGREFIKDADLEEIIVPALRDAAKGIQIAGKDIDVALENAINQIRTVGPVGVGSGSMGGIGRTTFAGSYRGARSAAQTFAMGENPEAFRRTERFSQSRGKTVKSFQTLNPMLNNWEVATMSHITNSVTASVEDLTKQMTPYLGNVGAKVTQAVTKKIAVGAAKEAQVASPSRETEMVGASIAQGFIVGAEGYIDDAKAVGSKLGAGMVQTPSGLFIPGGAAGTGGGTPRTPGVPLSVITENARRNREQLLATQQQRRTAAMNARMNTLNKAFMSGTFALSALSGVASMAGGNLGKFSEILFQISGPLFALSSVIQLLTGEKIIKLISRFKVGFGLASVALLAGIGIIKLVNNARAKEQEAIYGLSNAMKTTTGQVKTLGDFFNIIPSKLPIEMKNREIVNQPTRSARDRLRESEGFKKEYGSTIKTLSKSTAEQARLAFTSIAIDLRARGFANEQIQTIIDALREEAGKTSVKLDVKSLNFSADSIKDLQNQIIPLLVNFQKQIDKGLTRTVTIGGGKAGVRTYTTQTNDAKKAISELVTFNNTIMSSAAGQFRLKLIDEEQFKNSLNLVLDGYSRLGKEAEKIALLETFKAMGIEGSKLVPVLGNVASKMKVIALLNLGLLDKDSPVIKGLQSTDLQVLAESWKQIDKIYGEALKKINKTTGLLDPNNPDGPNAPGKPNALEERIKGIQNQTNAFKILRKAKIDEATATELSNDAEIASLIVKNSNGKSLKQIIELVNKYKKALADQTKAEFQYMSGPNLFKAQLERAQAQAALREKLIDMQFAPQIKKENDALAAQERKLADINAQIEKVTRSQIEPIQAVIDSNNLALEKIALQEDAVNEKYNKQIDALEKIASVNQDIANIQRQRLSIADALTRGDISSAAQLMQDARAEQAQSAVTGQKEALTATRDAAIAALGRNAIEKQNKELQLQINIIEATQLKTLQSQKQTIEDTIASINSNITALNEQVRVTKEGYGYAKGTKEEMDNLDSLIAAAEAAGIKFDAVLLSQAGNANSLAAALERALKAQQQLGSGATTFAEIKAGASGPNPTITPQTITDAQRATVLQGIKDLNAKIASTITKINSITGKNLGGRITKYMAFGGKAVGADTIPAMLTPGEFVVNKAAAQRFGPMLKTINDSKYPSMLNGMGGTTVVPINNISTSMNDNSTAVYNYNLGFNINGNTANANEIARAVMREVKNVDAQRIRGQRQ